jgi:GT2 family glycosyltransferase
MKYLSIVVITHNSQSSIFNCLNSIFLQKKDEDEVIIVDNSSYDETVKIIKNNFSNTTLLCNRKNLGYSVALNQGIKKTKGEYILVLNGDVILEKNFIKKLNVQMEQLSDDIGMISPTIIKTDGRIDSTGLFLSPLRRLYDRRKRYKNDGEFNLSNYIFGPCGACAVYKKDMLEDIKIGDEYFDVDFFLLVEDFDIAWRANLLGWRGLYISELICVHRGGISRIKSKLSQYYAFRNRYFLLIKNESIWGFLRFIIYMWVYDVPRLIYLLITNKYAVKALKDIGKLLPIMIKKRNTIRKKRSSKILKYL